jgi:maltose operon protein
MVPEIPSWLACTATAASLLAACATATGPRAALEAAPVCCQAWSELPVRPLAPGQEAAFELRDASPVFAFPSGKAYFQAFRLPAGIEGAELALTSRLPTRSPSAWDAFCPALTFLDQDYRPIETRPTQAQFAPHLPRWEVAVSAPTGARYVVVHAGAGELAGSRPLRYPVSGISLPATYQPGTSIEGGLITSEAPCGLRGRHGIRATAAATR